MSKSFYLGLAAIALSQQPTREVPLDFRNCQSEVRIVRGKTESGKTCEVKYTGRRLGHAISIESYQGPDTSLARYLKELERANETYSPEQMRKIITAQTSLGVSDRDSAVGCDIIFRQEEPASTSGIYRANATCFFTKTKVPQLPKILP